jgi:hypothetical protein
MPDRSYYMERIAAVTSRGASFLRELAGKLRTAQPRTLALALGVLVLTGVGTCMIARRAPTRAPAPAPVSARAGAPATPVVANPVQNPASVVIPSAPSPGPVPTTSRIEFVTVPAVEATVSWGKTRLGRILPRTPLVVTRPRDSGPLDVIVRAEGFLPVHTRANTFGDTRLLVKLTTEEEKPMLFGYRAPIDAGIPLTDPSLLAPPAPPLVPSWP